MAKIISIINKQYANSSIKKYIYLNIKVVLNRKIKKAVDTGTSQAVPHLSTNPALRRLTSEFEWDPVFSP